MWGKIKRNFNENRVWTVWILDNDNETDWLETAVLLKASEWILPTKWPDGG